MGVIAFTSKNGIKEIICKGDRILRAASIEAYTKKKALKFKSFIIMIDHTFKKLELQDSEILAIVKIICNLKMDNCVVRDSESDPIRSIKDFELLFGKKKTVTTKIVQSLINKRVLVKTQTRINPYYLLNPHIAFKGKINNIIKYAFENYNIIFPKIK